MRRKLQRPTRNRDKEIAEVEKFIADHPEEFAQIRAGRLTALTMPNGTTKFLTTLKINPSNN